MRGEKKTNLNQKRNKKKNNIQMERKVIESDKKSN